VVYIGWRGDRAGDASRIADYFDQTYYISAGKFRRYHGESFLSHFLDVKTLLLNARDFFRVIAGIFSALRLLKKLRPSVVFSKGSFVAVPVGLAAHARGIPIITHDSDTVPGLANRIIGRWASVRALGQPLDHYKDLPPASAFTGIPIDESLKPVSEKAQQELKRSLGLPARSQLLLIVGGGLGSESVNKQALAAIPKLLSNYPNLYVTHITGVAHQDKVRALYELDPADSSRLSVMGFTNDYKSHAGAADLVVSRAGATALAELAILRKPVILIPAPHLADGHQMTNAKQLDKAGAVRLVSDDASGEQFYLAISGLLDNAKQRGELASALATRAVPDAASGLAKLILQAAGQAKH